jgi:hypothetical protein
MSVWSDEGYAAYAIRPDCPYPKKTNPYKEWHIGYRAAKKDDDDAKAPTLRQDAIDKGRRPNQPSDYV